MMTNRIQLTSHEITHGVDAADTYGQWSNSPDTDVPAIVSDEVDVPFIQNQIEDKSPWPIVLERIIKFSEKYKEGFLRSLHYKRNVIFSLTGTLLLRP